MRPLIQASLIFNFTVLIISEHRKQHDQRINNEQSAHLSSFRILAAQDVRQADCTNIFDL